MPKIYGIEQGLLKILQGESYIKLGRKNKRWLIRPWPWNDLQKLTFDWQWDCMSCHDATWCWCDTQL